MEENKFKCNVCKKYYDAFNPIKIVDAKYKTLIKASLDKKGSPKK